MSDNETADSIQPPVKHSQPAPAPKQ